MPIDHHEKISNPRFLLTPAMLAKLKNFAGMVYFLLAVFKWDRYRRITFDPSKDLPDLDGKVAIVTGGKCVRNRLWISQD